jgi:tRNA A-37 threonylcarbamoyl transferase component Bud32
LDSSAHANLEPELPRRIGRYDAFLEIGSGGMARVYLAVQHGPFKVDRLVVIKQLREEIANDPQFLEMFVDEARIALRLNHPNVVHTYEVLDESPDYYLVMEYLEGQSLLEVFRKIGRQRVPLQDHLWILTQLLAGLHYAHELRAFDGTPLQIVHRDVTPSNVFICRTGAVKLLDFGIAKLAGAVAATRTGMLKGKLGYVAPEQCLGKQATVQSDIYAVGVMLWEAMARRRRTNGETQAAQIQARIQGAEPSIESVWPHAPAALVAITRRALSTRPEGRYATAREFQHDLERYLAQKQSGAGAESVARLLRQHFEKERAAMHRAIARRFENAGATVADASRGASEALSMLEHGDTARSTSDDSDARTSLVSIDRQLLKATRRGARTEHKPSELARQLLDYVAPLARRFRLGPSQRARRTRRTPRRGLTFGMAAIAAALASTSTKLPSDRIQPGAGKPEPTSSAAPPPPPAPPIRATPPSAPPRAAPPPRPETFEEFSSQIAALPAPPDPDEGRDRPRRAEPSRSKLRARRADEILYSRVAAFEHGGSKRPTQPARPRAKPETAAPENRASSQSIEPGMDLKSNPFERQARCIDEEGPY